MEIAKSPEKETAFNGRPDQNLLAKFNSQIKSKVPHWEEGANGSSIQNPTPVTDLTNDLIVCARTEYGLELPGKVRIFGKLDSQIYGGAVKVRPMLLIIEVAIKTGHQGKAQVIFDVT